MNEKTYEQQDILPDSPTRRWLKCETRRNIIFPVSLIEARTRLKLGLSSPFRERNGIFFTDYEYSGELDGNTLRMSVTTHGGRSGMTFNVKGQLYLNEEGARLALTIENSLFILIAPIVGLLLFMVSLKSPFEFILPVCFGFFFYAMATWHRNVAADKTTKFLRGIIENPSLESN